MISSEAAHFIAFFIRRSAGIVSLSLAHWFATLWTKSTQAAPTVSIFDQLTAWVRSVRIIQVKLYYIIMYDLLHVVKQKARRTFELE